MIEARLSQLAAVLDARLITGDAAFAGVSTDTRSVKPGELFVALRGERYDAHEFLDAAKKNGAVAAIVEREVDTVDLPQIVVLDTQTALGDIARWWRGFIDAKVVGITGSNGKTTVKTLTASILSRAGRTHFNAGNLNNEIGLPLSILRMPGDTEFAVLEMGAGKPGDIAYLADIGRPTIALVNNVAPAHLERMGSLEGVADTKGAIYDALPADGVAVVNADCMFSPRFVARTKARSLRFGLEGEADVTAEIRSLGATSRFLLKTPKGNTEVELPMAGRHNVKNALAATALALAAGASLEHVKEGLEKVQGVSGRLTRHTLPNGATVIDDSYNANPGSVRAAIDTLALERGDRWLVLGNMAELGPSAFALHEEIGRHALDAGIDHLVTVGALAAGASAAFDRDAHHCDSQREAIGVLEKALAPDAIVLVKGSRSAGMERIVDALLGRTPAQGGHHAA